MNEVDLVANAAARRSIIDIGIFVAETTRRAQQPKPKVKHARPGCSRLVKPTTARAETANSLDRRAQPAGVAGG
jgi:hypothetical protein